MPADCQLPWQEQVEVPGPVYVQVECEPQFPLFDKQLLIAEHAAPLGGLFVDRYPVLHAHVTVVVPVCVQTEFVPQPPLFVVHLAA